jgi:hypothetical protein
MNEISDNRLLQYQVISQIFDKIGIQIENRVDDQIWNLEICTYNQICDQVRVRIQRQIYNARFLVMNQVKESVRNSE